MGPAVKNFKISFDTKKQVSFSKPERQPYLRKKSQAQVEGRKINLMPQKQRFRRTRRKRVDLTNRTNSLEDLDGIHD